jgi:hypothetical protein
VDHEVFAGRQVIEQLTQQIEVGTVAFFMGLADVFGMADQAPEHHPGTEQLRIHDPRRKRTNQKCIYFFRWCADLLDFVEEGSGEFAGELLVRVGDQGIDAAEMMIEQANRNPGFGGDAPHGDTGMAVTDQATQRRGN